mmetsp:Transcript_34907/g.53573  ORF Transcript_34907/g.53573 Transcript_34907/m.53573 type:complete len:247 (-) Transcript_34907:1547-2287(-)
MPFLVYDNQEIRELSCRVFITIFKRMGDSQVTQNILGNCFLEKLNTLIHSKDKESQKQITNLIAGVKFITETAFELKIEDKIMNLCEVPSHKLTKPLTTTQAVILRAIAPKVAPLVFNKKYYNTFYMAMTAELTQEPKVPEIQSEERTQAILMCFAELMANVPTNEYVMTNEEIICFHDACIKRNTYGLYIDLIKYYCENTPSNYEKHAKFYAMNVLKHINSPDKAIIEKVTGCLSAIFAKIPKEA